MTWIRSPTDRRPGFLNSAPTFDGPAAHTISMGPHRGTQQNMRKSVAAFRALVNVQGIAAGS